MKRKKLLVMLGSVCLALVLALPLVASCGPATPEEAAEEIAALELEIDELEGDVSAKDAEISDLEEEIAALRAPGEVYEWRLQHTWAASENMFFDYYADIVREMSGGRIDISVFSSGELANTIDFPEALVKGTLDIANAHPGYYGGIIPGAGIDLSPFLWRNMDEWMATHYQMGLNDAYQKAFEEAFDIYMIGNMCGDPMTFMWVDDFSCLADLKGRRLSLSAGILTEILEEDYGVSSVWLAPEDRYTSLATGVIDGATYGSAAGMYAIGFHEVAKYLMLPYPCLTLSYPYFMSTELWNSLPSELQAILAEGCKSSAIYTRSFYDAVETEALSKMVNEWGVEVVTLPDEDVRAITVACVAKLDALGEEGGFASEAVSIIKEAMKVFGRID